MQVSERFVERYKFVNFDGAVGKDFANHKIGKAQTVLFFFASLQKKFGQCPLAELPIVKAFKLEGIQLFLKYPE